ncbi:hypothetical protein BPAE_0008g00390 [Botrytis paeoniae]|uniref:Uncharacterized protein n=1 Tax=Botrytis paeoniae TaxID=278948 RepID=A0A4Z1G7Q6_9HELO|nr:hypothetical protein BPAE_0008g00390 [Botrytis paeoniae]
MADADLEYLTNLLTPAHNGISIDQTSASNLADSNVPQILSGSISLFTDPNCSGTRTDICLEDYAINQRHAITSAQLDATTVVLYNLPHGTVVTLIGARPDDPVNIADYKNCDCVVDLVGYNHTKLCTLPETGLNDDLSMFFWRKVDLRMGVVELFCRSDFTHARVNLWLCEWEPGVVHSLEGWDINDDASSARWRTLLDRQSVILYQYSDGTGKTYNNIKGWGGIKQISDFSDVDFNDTASAWKWEAANPIKEIIAPFTITSTASSSSVGLTSVVDGTNDSDQVQPVVVTLNNTKEQTVTVQTSDQHVVGVSSTFSTTATEGVEGVASDSATWSVSLNYSYTHTDTVTRSDTQTVGLNISQTINAPPHTTYVATLLVTIGRLPPTEYHTTAQRWYTSPVTGSEVDPANNNWYKRVEDVKVTIDGSLACHTSTNIKTTPL